ncbi:Rrp15p-domain-containing protein [Elsinoe ampelina]|uniref:Rrp15p-domain-containing protein n=1 Tax=Elsinoe ampelina TaxID=302913 RepID=A0A6A6G4F3_9PEZI|nr:Rrp15p-domain-containing protein [Elsinoe ampelina]
MPSAAPKRKRTVEHLHKAKKPKRFRKQKNYHSSSEDESEDEGGEPDFAPVNMAESSDEEGTDDAPSAEADEDDDGSESAEVLDDLDAEDDMELEDDDLLDSDASMDSGSQAESQVPARKTKKRNDPSAFTTSMQKILSSKLSNSKRSDPVLSRSVDASTANRELTDSRLEAKAKAKLRAEKKAALERGRVKDVLGLETEGVSAAEVQEREKRLKKTAQRGVVKLFNAVRAAQVQADVAREQARKEGVVGMAQREERINEMSKKSFLDLIAKGGKKG